MARRLFSILMICLFAAGGCVVGPDYHHPQASAPSQWSEPLAEGETDAPAVLVAWWKTFHDPVLDGLMDRAVRSNPDLRIAQARVLEARAQYGIAFSDLWPSANISGSYARQEQSHHQPILGKLPLPPNVPFENSVYQPSFDASWELDVFGGRQRALEAAHAEVGAFEYGRRATLITLMGDVARNYLDVRGYQRRLAIARGNIQAQEEVLDITRDRFINGLTAELDVQQAITILATTRADIPRLESLLQASIHRLGVLLGQPPGGLLSELAEEAPIPVTPPEVPVGLPSELLLRRPDVQRAERELAAATARIGVAKADLFPKFYLTGVAGLQSTSPGDLFSSESNFWSIGPTIRWRIFDAGRVRANIKVQDARQEQALAAYEKVVLSAFEEVENALVSYSKEQVRLRSLKEAVESSRNSLEHARRLYENGVTDFLAVLEAERSLYLAQDQFVQSQALVSVDLVSLYKVLGGGWEDAGP